MWAVGCIFAELLTLKPLFQGAEVKATPNPFQVLDAMTYTALWFYSSSCSFDISIALSFSGFK